MFRDSPARPRPRISRPIQQYGLGLPTNYIQGFGNPVSKIRNKPIAWFAQDSWKIRRNVTLNYGVRYDYEITQQIAPVGVRDPFSGINLSASDILAAQDAVNVQQGIPRDKNNFAPRLGIAWDVKGDAKTVIRAATGIFYDHPLLAIAFNSDIADAAQQQQGILTPVGGPSPLALLNATQVFQGTVVICNFAGAVPGVNCTPGAAASAQYQAGRQRFNDQTFPGFGPVLPFTLPVSKNFEYAYANQANFTIERQLTKDMSISAGYLFVGAHHLPHPLDINAPRTDLQIENFRRCFGTLPTNTTAVLTVSPSACSNIVAQLIPGLIVVNTTRGGVIAPAAANFFRPNAPNYFLVQALTGGAVTPAVLNAALAASGTLRTPGVVSPFGSVNAQVSDGNSNYNALTIDLKKRFTRNFQFLASYTWSHSIDDSSDLQTASETAGQHETSAPSDFRQYTSFHLGERLRLDIIAEGFNLFNRFNEASANPFYQVVNAFAQRSSSGRYYSQPTAAYDPRQFQFGLKLNF